MYRAGDVVQVVAGAAAGHVGTVSSVRWFAADRGYYCGAGGLIPAADVVLMRVRDGGNPCGVGCDMRLHEDVGSCEHCRGVCDCRRIRGTRGGLREDVARDPARQPSG